MQVKVYVKEMKQRGRKWGFAPFCWLLCISGYTPEPPPKRNMLLSGNEGKGDVVAFCWDGGNPLFGKGDTDNMACISKLAKVAIVVARPVS